MYRRHRFGGPRRRPRQMVKEKIEVSKLPHTCETCGVKTARGETLLKLKVRLRYRQKCPTCASSVVSRWFHNTPQCKPADYNLAMGLDPNARRTHSCVNCGHTQPTAFGKHCPNCGESPIVRKSAGGSVAPPPKPKTSTDLTLEAVAALEAALIAQVRERKKPMTPELDGEFKKFQGIKQRILRPGTPGEEQAALVVGLQRLVKLVF